MAKLIDHHLWGEFQLGTFLCKTNAPLFAIELSNYGLAIVKGK